MRKAINWLSSTRFVQWFMLTFRWPGNPDGWIFVRKDDPRFSATPEKDRIWYDGDPNVPPTTMTTDRSKWKTWIVVGLPNASPVGFLAFDIFDGRRLICFGRPISHGMQVAFRIGHEGAHVFLLTWKPHAADLADWGTARLTFVARVSAEELEKKYPRVHRL